MLVFFVCRWVGGEFCWLIILGEGRGWFMYVGDIILFVWEFGDIKLSFESGMFEGVLVISELIKLDIFCMWGL